jgi:tRNA(Ile)-lysidine synthase
MDVLKTLEVSWQKLLEKAAPQPVRSCTLALSGGMDSVVLLHALKKTPSIPIQQVIHVHHKLSPNADAWANHCMELCAKYHIPCSVEQVEVDRKHPQGLEAAARQARYQVFDRYNHDVLLTAHHQDDQLETFGLYLLRGGKPHALAGMQEFSQRRHYLVWRPLLSIPRETLALYAEEHHLIWVDDESNGDLKFRRNWLRHRCISYMTLEQRQALLRSMAQQRSASECLDELAQEDLERCGGLDDSIHIPSLLKLSLSRQNNLLNYVLRMKGLTLSHAALDNFIQQISIEKTDCQTSITLSKNYVWRVWRENLLLCNEIEDIYPLLSQEYMLLMPPPSVQHYVEALNGYWVESSDGSVGLYDVPYGLRLRREGDRLGRTPLKKIFQKHHIPYFQRDRWPVIVNPNNIHQVWAVYGLEYLKHHENKIHGTWQLIRNINENTTS